MLSANNGILLAATRHVVFGVWSQRIFSCHILSEGISRITFIASCSWRVRSVVLKPVVGIAHPVWGGKNCRAKCGKSLLRLRVLN